MSIAPFYEVVKLKRSQSFPAKDYAPYVSVVIPAYNEAVGLLHTVKTILKSEYRNIEIIVINDGSTDNSDSMMREFIKKYEEETLFDAGRIPIMYQYKENGGKGRALNAGLSLSSGEIIISVDADCALATNTIGNFIKPFADPSVMAGVGNVKVGNTNTIVGTVQSFEFLFSFYFKKAESVLGAIYIIGGAAGAFRREVFEKIGVYNQDNITEDIELSVRIQKAGMKIVYVDDAIVYTEGASSLLSLAQQRTRWRMGWFQTLSSHRSIIFNRSQNKFLSFYILPAALFSNFQLVFEPWFMIFVFVYSYMTGDFTSYITWIGIEFSMVILVALFERERSARFFVAGPILWLLFFVSTYVEYHSLMATLRAVFLKKKVMWQKWDRKGCADVMINV